MTKPFAAVPANLPSYGSAPQAGPGLWKSVVLYALATMTINVLLHIFISSDYVGIDNDDVMRLVQVRDLLAGQSWFDTTQYRLGLDGGTLMHWSRLIDLPIAALIAFFNLFFSRETAEAAALLVWPLSLTVPVFYAVALGCFRLGGRPAMQTGMVLAAILLIGGMRFRPGAIDHHNVQIALIAMIAAMLLDPEKKAGSYALAGAMAGIAIAIGVETTPMIAVVSLAVSLLWAWHGALMKAAAQSFGLALAAVVTAAFFATTPPRLYSIVTCDNLSVGFYALATFGGSALFLTAAALSHKGRLVRFAGLGACGIVIAGAVLLIAPQCLQNPLGGMDPLLQSLWLDNVTEARSLIASLRYHPASLAPSYAAGLLAMAVCLSRIARGQATEAYILLLSMLTVCILVAAFQVRGAAFSNLLSLFPLSVVIANLRARSNADPKNLRYGLTFAAMSLASVPTFWAVAGSYLLLPDARAMTTNDPSLKMACDTPEAMAGLAQEPTGVVAASMELGAKILRFTHHRALSAPYHRNPGGMLAVMHIGLAAPEDAQALMRQAGVTVLAFCPNEAPTQIIANLAPDGLYAQLGRDIVPDYLLPLSGYAESGLRLFRVAPPHSP